MIWKKLFKLHREGPDFSDQSANMKRKALHGNQSNWPPSVNGEIVGLWHNPANLKPEDKVQAKVRAILTNTAARAIGTRDLIEVPGIEVLPFLQIPIKDQTHRSWTVVEQGESGALKHLMIEFRDNEQLAENLSDILRVGLAVEPNTPAFCATSVFEGKKLFHLFWPFDWSDAATLMPLGAGPYWQPPFTISHKDDVYSLNYEKLFLEKFGSFSPSALEDHYGSVGVIVLTQRYLDLQRNWDLFLLQNSAFWPSDWPDHFRQFLAQFGNHRLWPCRNCDRTFCPDIPITSDLVERILDPSLHGDLPEPFTMGFTSRSVVAWPITPSTMFCQTDYECRACNSTFRRSEFIDTTLCKGELPDLGGTETPFHQCPKLCVKDQPLKRAKEGETATQDGIESMSSIEKKIAEFVSNLPGKREFEEHNDLNSFDVDGLLAALDSDNRTRQLIAIEKLAWSLYGKDSSRVEDALVLAMHDKDKYVAIRSANTLLMEGQSDYRDHVVAASEDLSIDENIRLSFRGMIAMTDKMRKKKK